MQTTHINYVAFMTFLCFYCVFSFLYCTYDYKNCSSNFSKKHEKVKISWKANGACSFIFVTY